MKSDEADAAIAHLLDRFPDLRVVDHLTYFRIESEDDLVLDVDEVSAYLGRALAMDSFLLTLSAYFGQIHIDDGVLRISPVGTS